MTSSGSVSGSDTPAIEKLEATIVEANKASDRQTRTMVRLTWAIAVMTFVMVILVVVQIWIALKLH
jgi:nitrate/nitrite-specific signal transduction histidine kinase